MSRSAPAATTIPGTTRSVALPRHHPGEPIPLAPIADQTLAADGSVQATVFSDGTRVVANFSGEERQIGGAGLLGPRSWRASGQAGA